jgi:hypothetical protein
LDGIQNLSASIPSFQPKVEPAPKSPTRRFLPDAVEDPVIAEAIVDRLIHPSQKTTLKGKESYREKLT